MASLSIIPGVEIGPLRTNGREVVMSYRVTRWAIIRQAWLSSGEMHWPLFLRVWAMWRLLTMR